MNNALTIEGKASPVCAVWATNRQALIGALTSLVASSQFLQNLLDGKPLLTLELKDCNSKVVYQNVDDIPHESVPCRCGKHWLIKYGDLDEKG